MSFPQVPGSAFGVGVSLPECNGIQYNVYYIYIIYVHMYKGIDLAVRTIISYSCLS